MIDPWEYVGRYIRDMRIKYSDNIHSMDDLPLTVFERKKFQALCTAHSEIIKLHNLSVDIYATIDEQTSLM